MQESANVTAETTSSPSARSSSPDRRLALDWARDHIDVEKYRRVSSRPWAKTYRLKSANGDAFLKILAPVLSGTVDVTARLAERFPETVPATIATDAERGLLLSAGHGGRDFDRKPGEERRVRLLCAYARIQANSRLDDELLGALAALETGSLVEELLSFLTPGELPRRLDGAKVSADHFLSDSRCETARALLGGCAAVLQRYVDRCAALPVTINHGDLRPSNAAEDGSGTLKLYDWDEALAGPAGLSLHAMFSGSTKVLEVLDDSLRWNDPEELRQARRELGAYVDALVEHGYADRDALLAALGPATVAGMIHYIVGFSRFPKDSSDYRRTVRGNVKRRLGDLFDVCDRLCLEEGPDAVHERARTYVANGNASRAVKLLGRQLERRADDGVARAELGRLLRERDRLSRSIRVLSRGLERVPNDASMHAEIGLSYACDGDYVRAQRHLRRSLAERPDGDLEARLANVRELEHSAREADLPGTVPTVAFSAEERERGYSPEKLRLCTELFGRHGTLLMKGVFDPALLRECHDTFVDRYRSYLNDERHKDALRIGDKRFQITVDMAPPYNAPSLYGNRLIVPLMKRLVGRDSILGCFVAVMSLPGSDEQRLHKDHKDLFHDSPDPGTHPSFAVTVMVPLVDLDERVGTTRVKKGSHRLDSARSKSLPYQTPFTTLGDCYLMDYRLSHHGQANRSERPRPILSMLYQRPWFRDYMNFRKQPSLRLDEEEFRKVPKELQPLLRWTEEPGPR